MWKSKWAIANFTCIDAFYHPSAKFSNGCFHRICWRAGRIHWKSTILPMKFVKKCFDLFIVGKWKISRATLSIFSTPPINMRLKIWNFSAFKRWSRRSLSTRLRKCWFERIFTIRSYSKIIYFCSSKLTAEKCSLRNNGNSWKCRSEWRSFGEKKIDRCVSRPYLLVDVLRFVANET